MFFPRYTQSICGCSLYTGSLCVGVSLMVAGVLLADGLLTFTGAEEGDLALALGTFKFYQGIAIEVLGILVLVSVCFASRILIRIAAVAMMLLQLAVLLASCVAFIAEGNFYLAAFITDLVLFLTAYMLGGALWSHAAELEADSRR